MHTSEGLSERFETGFLRIQEERMAGFPLLHPSLRVWVCGWRDWAGRRVGVLVTPWSMNLVCSPGFGGGPGVEHPVRFPSGDYVFIEAQEEGIGGFALCSLFSPVLEFADQAAAEATAAAALDALFDPRLAAQPLPAADAVADPRAELVLSRRDLLRGVMTRS